MLRYVTIKAISYFLNYSLQKTYTTYCKTLQTTGEGLKEEDQSEEYRNQLGELLVDFLHMLLRFLSI